ncbi:hypothetical protein POM88_017514 [Heracleum sosnowskyi]|uniref:Uncharacterized protein n=1 Tax=Heracleum sosnowskyi TaxID=360622 RepID=A0AAD8IR00_9APIA|nr:hypothetical protein POM88_017514 [Heracleum sosnowskyi]
MGERRPMFRFRLPWMHSSAPAPPTPVATQNPPRNETPSTTQPQTSTELDVKPMMPAQRPFRLQRTPVAQPPPPTEPTVKSQSLSGPITITSAPTIPPQAPPLWSPKITAAPETKSESQNSYQPTSPSRTESQKYSQLPSPSSSSPQFSATSQLPSPSFTTPQFSATSQLSSPQSTANSRPPSPLHIPSQEQDTSQLPSPKSAPQPSSPISAPQPSSPWHTSTQARAASQLPLIDQPQFEKSTQAGTSYQPQSPPQLNFQSSGQKSPVTSSPSLTTTNVQPTARTETRLPSPSKTLAGIESPQPSASSSKPLSSVSAKPYVHVSKPQSLEDQTKKGTTSSVTLKSSGPLSANTTPPRIAKEMPPQKMRLDDTLMPHEEPKQKTMAVHSSGSLTHKKEKPKVAFQAEQMQLTDQDMVWGKEEATTSKHCILDVKETKSMKPTDNKSTASESRNNLKSSNGDRVSFQKEIRSDISKLVDKMAAADPENFKDEKVSVVALVGKNEGASMQLGCGSVKNGEETKVANKTEPVEGTETNAGKTSAKRRWLDNEVNEEDQMTKAVINNNIQDINNSILMNSFFTERNPGVHLAFYYDATEPIKSYDKKGSRGACKGKSNLPLPRTSLPPEGDP